MKFKLHCYTKTKDNDLTSTVNGIVYFDDVKSALQSAKDLCHHKYYMNPVRDILEIMKELNVDEQTAGEIFMSELNKNTAFYVEEINETGNLVHYDVEGL